MVTRDVIPALQQLPDALDADAMQNMISMLEATPDSQGVWADNLPQLTKPKNPLSHLFDNTQSVAVVRSEECHLLLLVTVPGLCSDCNTLKH